MILLSIFIKNYCLMYLVRNKSLDTVYETLKTHDLYSLSDEQFEEACRILKIKPVYKTKTVGSSSRRIGLNKSETIKLIESMHSYDMYINQSYWTDEQLQIDEDLDLIGQMKNHISGRETFELMSRVKLGFSNLKPNQTQELDATMDWLQDEFGVHPLSKFIEVKDLSTGKILEFTAEKDEKGLIKRVTVDFVDRTKSNISDNLGNGKAASK